MAFIKLLEVRCDATSGGRIQLKIGPHVLLPFTHIPGVTSSLPIAISFNGAITIDLHDDSDSNSGVNSVASTTAITKDDLFSSRTINYDNGVCSGQYTLTFEVSISNPSLVPVA